jgi:hypothetical protein
MKPSTEPSSQEYTTTDHDQYDPSTAAYTSYGETERSGDQSPYEMSDDDGYSSSEAGDREYTYYEGEDEVGDTGRMLPARSTPRSAYPSSLAPLLQHEDLLAAVVACLEDDAEREFREAACNQGCEYRLMALHLEVALPSLLLPHGIARREATKRHDGERAIEEAALSWLAELLTSALWSCYARCIRSLRAIASAIGEEHEGVRFSDERARLITHLQASVAAASGADGEAVESGAALPLPRLRLRVLSLLRAATADTVGACAARLRALRNVAATCSTARHFERTRMLKLETSAGRALSEKLRPTSQLAMAAALQAADGSGVREMTHRALTATDLRLLRISRSEGWLTGLGTIQLILSPSRNNYAASIGPWSSALRSSGWTDVGIEVEDAQPPPGMLQIQEAHGALLRSGTYSVYLYSERPLTMPHAPPGRGGRGAGRGRGQGGQAHGDLPLMSAEAVAQAVLSGRAPLAVERWSAWQCYLKLIHGPLAGLCQVVAEPFPWLSGETVSLAESRRFQKFTVLTFGRKV